MQRMNKVLNIFNFINQIHNAKEQVGIDKSKNKTIFPKINLFQNYNF